MANNNSNGNRSAFPDHQGACYGLTKREWMAGMALKGMLSARNEGAFAVEVEVWAQHATRCADALLSELNKQS